ncbi:MAG: PD40 domain-containing protein, partial [Pyrinomonadaceae bacterium]|nr:PD40 domain-containing protein [Phycisphaerales bacterium]
MTNKIITQSILVLFAILPTSCRAVAPDGGGARDQNPSSTLARSGRELLKNRPDKSLVGYPQYPSLSPDGRSIVFSWAGDLWAARLPHPHPLPSQKSGEEARGGEAGPDPVLTVGSRLTANPAQERRSAFSFDGTLLAFESDRDGARNLYVMPVSSLPGADEKNSPDAENPRKGELAAFETPILAGEPRRVTFSDVAQTLGSFAEDGRALLFSAAQEPAVYRQARLYRAPLDGATVTRLTDAFGFAPRATPDGRGVLFGRGFSSIWERPAYRGAGAMEV